MALASCVASMTCHLIDGQIGGVLEQGALAERLLIEFMRGFRRDVRAVTEPQRSRDFVANRNRIKSLYDERRAAGLCVKCGAPALPGQVRCDTHRQLMLEQKQREKERP